jgi:hypothetical protein
MKPVIKIILALVGLALIVFVAIQFVPVDRSNPPVVAEPPWDSPQTRALAERACFDCHSNQTKWLWHSYIAPFSWLEARDVQQGRRRLNFSNWQPGRENEAARVIQRGSMPPQLYLLMHPEARLTDAEKQALIAGLNAALGPGEGGGGRGGGD